MILYQKSAFMWRKRNFSLPQMHWLRLVALYTGLLERRHWIWIRLYHLWSPVVCYHGGVFQGSPHQRVKELQGKTEM
ncbi:hypothetical protein [Bacillus atrophaeus]|uniref:hypothetical protein n=1 Tax=Bacillus atrophaeus TaxID=1452 RepID=UPI002DBFEBA5|nr:hypothetical protein [Bacillus atrophaeus]MEC1903022.1 hypothetical protein [Bacillus atrophaeus]MEC2399005.1 hypothetical protein [Bacillus atrophaeus]MED4435577.1 hypothetical protein [Bacillus atrophaeus]MED4574215.1 hypothetical protein [Bacillus atrophaeus]MED4778818.1 hypothetical protein [Bacillus atrophaeus]